MAPPRATVYLHPGQLWVARGPETLLTILGSCVAVCLWEAKTRFGGMCHFLLPYHGDGPAGTPRLGGVAIRQLIDRLEALGGLRRHIRAKLFGGANVLGARGAAALGARNVELARGLLADARIPLAAEDVGGSTGRRVIFETESGHAWVRAIGPQRASDE